MCSSTGSRSLRASSGSRSASSSIEPLRSAKRTVTCLRSPSRATLEVRIFSARCFGVYASGGRDVIGEIPWVSEAPHSPQNFCAGGFDTPQELQRTARRAPHSPQNFWLGTFSCWHRGHFIVWLVRLSGPVSPSLTQFGHAVRLAQKLALCAHNYDWAACNHSIIRSARRKSDTGIVSPIAFAVLRLTTSSNFVGCSTGRSPAFAPLRILST